MRDGAWWFRRCPPGGSSIRRVHRDQRRSQLSISMDVMLTDFSEANGATQIWPGTQQFVRPETTDVTRRAEQIPGVFITGTSGSVVLRDERAWHRGGLNHTPDARLMLSINRWQAGRSPEAKTA